MQLVDVPEPFFFCVLFFWVEGGVDGEEEGEVLQNSFKCGHENKCQQPSW